jgi:hypothetical protein
VRQRRLDGTPVIETALRVPGGDVRHRAFAVADTGGLVVVEVENDSPLPVAVAFSRGDVWTARPPSNVPPQGIDLPPGSVALPVGHHTQLRVAVAPGRPGNQQPLPPRLPSVAQVVNGWLAQTSGGARLELPDEVFVERLTAARSTLLLDGPPEVRADPAGHLLAAAELSRLGAPGEPMVDAVVRAATAVAKATADPWGGAALDAAGDVLWRAGEALGARDVEVIADRRGAKAAWRDAGPHDEPSDPARWCAWALERVAIRRGAEVDLLPVVPASWVGAPVAAYDVPVRRGLLSFGLRWHGERPALLWEAAAEGALLLRAPSLDPAWSSGVPKGEALLAAPPRPRAE